MDFYTVDVMHLPDWLINVPIHLSIQQIFLKSHYVLT